MAPVDWPNTLSIFIITGCLVSFAVAHFRELHYNAEPFSLFGLFDCLDTFSSAVWYRYKPARYRLEGTRSTACGELYFPLRHGLICPVCHVKSVEPYSCAQTGEIITAAPDDVGFPATGYGEALPRQIVVVRLDDGIHILTEIKEVGDPAQASSGARVKMVLRKHKREDTGSWVYGYRFTLDVYAPGLD